MDLEYTVFFSMYVLLLKAFVQVAKKERNLFSSLNLFCMVPGRSILFDIFRSILFTFQKMKLSKNINNEKIASRFIKFGQYEKAKKV